jgi:adenylate cyclase
VSAKPVNLNQNMRAIAGLVVVATVIGLLLPVGLPFVRIAEHWLYDVRVGYVTPPRPMHPDIVLVTVTEDTLSTLPFRSPLDRKFLAGVIEHLSKSEVRAIGIDYIFDQPTVAENDVFLHQTLRNSKVPIVVGEAAPQTVLTEKQRTFQAAFLDVLTSAYVNVITDTDGVVRQAYRGQSGPDGWKPGLADAVAHAAGISLTKDVRPIAFYPALDGELPYQAFRSFPAHAVKLLPKEWFKDKIVLFGAELTFDDRLSTPVSRTVGKVPGLYSHAFALAEIIDDRHIKTLPRYIQILLVAALAAAGAILAVARWPIYLRWVAIFVVLMGAWTAAVMLYRVDLYMIPLLSPTLALLFAAGFGTIYLGYQERQQKRFLRDAFSRYVSPNLVDDIISHPDKLELEGERRYLTFIFTDLASFTSLAEQLDPGDIVGLLNGYIDGMCAIVFRHGGTVDKIVGDAVAAYWGAPLDQEDQRKRAVDCALEMDAFAEDYRQRNLTVAGMLGITRIGINSGTAIIGNFGGVNFFDYTAHGDMVNTAARLEGANKYTGTRICVGEETRRGCPDMAFRSVAGLVLKGKTEPLHVFEPVPNMESDLVEKFEDAYKALTSQNPDALSKYQALNAAFPNDPISKLHVERLKAGESGDVITLAGK